ncbi:MAG TPA: DUF504 domain-containing protein [Candidatus Nanoarchaeia archaeon]|nr:DUF504 domain-containing protein [Candidatus Nanoarchaeia archaeon]
MITIKALLNKIKWDKNLNPGDYNLYYLDRISKTLKKLEYSDIIRIEGTFIIINNEKRDEVNIPMHRVRRVENKDVVVWQR